MNNQATLDRLRELKLTGMFQAFEALLQLPIHQQPPADELLAQLTDAEHEYRQQRKTQMAIRAARFRYAASLEELHYGDGRNLDKTAILRLADCRFIDRSENIFLTGATGCGKSYIASALGYQACQLGYRVGYHNLIKLLQRLQLAKADGSYQKEMSRLERLNLLILDDWGLQPLDQHAQLALLQIMAAAARKIGMGNRPPSSPLNCRLTNGTSILVSLRWPMPSWIGLLIKLIDWT